MSPPLPPYAIEIINEFRKTRLGAQINAQCVAAFVLTTLAIALLLSMVLTMDRIDLCIATHGGRCPVESVPPAP